MIIFSGGTGTPKLIKGLMQIMPPEDLTIVVNTAEDVWVSGNIITPDIDTVLYLLSGRLDEHKWWGIEGDTLRTYEAMRSVGFDEGMMIGDLDRATHIMRSKMVREGMSLTETTQRMCELFGIKAHVYPMSDDTVSTMITTPDGKLHYQDFWVKAHGEPEVLEVSVEGLPQAMISPAVLDALNNEDEVLIGPSNPITSIGPIIDLPGMREKLMDKRVVAISPIIGAEPVSGPAAKLMRACGYEVSSTGVAQRYQGLLDAFVHDVRDDPLGNDIGSPDCRIVRADTLMRSADVSKELARYVCGIFESM
ncbi:MAG: 2-phospho-L-lactate transferase [Methanosarcinaceae archaeon]|nr:2-phospho-L-lactate transferase [Methanosarcinaceae archaeon]